MCGHHQPACKKDDGHSLRGHADLRCVRVRRTGRTEPADAGRCDPGRSKAVLKYKKEVRLRNIFISQNVLPMTKRLWGVGPQSLFKYTQIFKTVYLYTLNRNNTTSPSFTTYSFPSMRTSPFSLAPA